MGVSRDTIYRWIATVQLDRDLDDEAVWYRSRAPVPSKLDPYKAIIDVRLAEYPKLTATRLFKEVQDAGYPGSYSQVKRYVRRVRPRPPEEPVQRFETPPGHQGQVDFADFRLPWGKRHALIVVLGYSRLMWLRYYERQTMPVVMRGLESAFRYFGGLPSELLFDQMKAVITADGRAEGGRLVENPEFLRFSHHWGFRIRACRPYRAQTPGQRCALAGLAACGDMRARAAATDRPVPAMARGSRTHPPQQSAVRMRASRRRTPRGNPTLDSTPCSRSQCSSLTWIDSHRLVEGSAPVDHRNGQLGFDLRPKHR